ncbi:MAG: replicative DNA helicase [Acidobacteria bacterium]|nr:replicative DNA helicase [Acidobacteriota bacterium]
MSAEQAVLGALMLVPDALAKIALVESDFYRRDHRLIFRAMVEQDRNGKPFDAVTLGEHFTGDDVSPEYLIDLAQTATSAAMIRHHADLVRQKSVLRQAIDIAGRVTSGAYAGADAPILLDDAIRDLMALVKAEQGCEYTLRPALIAAMDDVDAAVAAGGKIRGITTGFERFDKRIGGWHKGDLVFIGARPSMGKTALMVNLALNAAKAGHSVGVISGEQSAMQIGQRSASSESRVHAERMRNGDIDDEAWPQLTEAMSRLVNQRVRIYDRSAPTMEELSRVARRWKQEHGIEVLFVDYLQRIRAPKAESRIDEVSEVARSLKTLARDLDIPVVCLAQVKAEVDKRNDSRPGLGDIANSDEATREADLIAFLYRDEVYKDDTNDKGVAELNVEKYRHGPTGQFRLRFHGETMRFDDMEDYGRGAF